MKEEWKQILGTKWYYVSNKWRIKSYKLNLNWKILRSRLCGKMQHICIEKNNYNVMRLVAKEFMNYSYWDKRIKLKDYTLIDWKYNVTPDNISLSVPSLINRYRKELRVICKKHNLCLEREVMSKRRDKYIQEWRAECYMTLYRKGLIIENIGAIFNKNHAGIIYILYKYYPEEYKKKAYNYKKVIL